MIELSSPVGIGTDPSLLRMNSIREYSSQGTGYIIEHIDGKGFRFVRIEEDVPVVAGEFSATPAPAMGSAVEDYKALALEWTRWGNELHVEANRQESHERSHLNFRAAHYASAIDRLFGQDLAYIVQKDQRIGSFRFIFIDARTMVDFVSEDFSSLRALYRSMGEHSRANYDPRRYLNISVELNAREEIPSKTAPEQWLAVRRIGELYPEFRTHFSTYPQEGDRLARELADLLGTRGY